MAHVKISCFAIDIKPVSSHRIKASVSMQDEDVRDAIALLIEHVDPEFVIGLIGETECEDILAGRK